MSLREILNSFFALWLVPASLGIAALALREQYAGALALYCIAWAFSFLIYPPNASWPGIDSWARAVQSLSRRCFLLAVLLTLNHLGSCPTWFMGLMLAASLMKWCGFLFIRPSRLDVPVMPEIKQWNTLAQIVIPGIFFSDLLLIQLFPANLRFSENFHLTGYAFLGALQLLQLAHDFYRVRRPILFWIRALAFQPR